MKLIDLLVQELAGKGGWPSVGTHCVQDSNGHIWFFHNGTPFYERGIWAADSESNTFDWTLWGIYLSCTAKDHKSSIVTREQYEAALAASHQPAWNGELPPPVGVKCEHCPGGTTQTEWEVVTVLGISERPGGMFTDYWLRKEDGSSYIIGNAYRFRPIRSEEERKRDDLKAAIAELCRQSASNGHSADLIYEAIADGKIPGVKLEASDE